MGAFKTDARRRAAFIWFVLAIIAIAEILEWVK
jgi:hypothetical protein